MGPINPQRYEELQQLFGNATAQLIYMTALLDKKALTKYVAEIAWGTEVWLADSPSHLLQFNGERHLGSYDGE